MTKLLTVSIAAYNMEKYIRQALDSLLSCRHAQSIEIFVIDDGGTDHTLEIAKEYAWKHPGTVIPVHKENGGYGSTINYSIEHATGKYFKQLDGDDGSVRTSWMILSACLEMWMMIWCFHRQ